MPKKFHLGDILSVTTGYQVSPRNMEGIIALIDYMMVDKRYDDLLPINRRECRTYLFRQMPWLDSSEIQFALGELILMLETPSGKQDPTHLVLGWLSRLTAKHGEMHEVVPIHEMLDAVEESNRMGVDNSQNVQISLPGASINPSLN